MHIKGIMVTLVTLLMAISSFGQLVPTVYTDKADYQPGEVVIIEGDGWRPGEQVKLEIDHSTITHGNTVLYATADDRGHIRNEQYVIQAIHWGESFILTATGMSSGFTATTTFTDGNAFTATVTPNSVNSGVSGSFTIRVSNISEISGQGQGQGQSAANVRSVEIAIPAGWTGIATTSITTSSNASSTFSFEAGTGYTNGYNSSIGNGVIRCKAVTGNGLQADTDPAPYVEITFTATSPVITSQTAYTFFAKASDRNDYTFSGNANISILKVNGNEQHPVVTVLACAAPSITTQPSGQTVTYGNNATFTFQTGTATYQWQESVNGGGSWNNISNGGIYSGVTTNTLTVAKPPVAYNNYRYRCMATSCASVTSTDVPLTVNKAGLTVTADNKNRIYGDNNPAFTVSYSGFVSGENASSLTTQPTAASTATAASAVGNYPIEPSGGVAANYSFSYVNGTLVIGQREVTVTADAQSKTYGDDDPELEYNVTTGSLVNGDDFTGALKRIAGEDVGEYAITIGDLALSGNYVLAYVGANLTIGQ
ncbi:immunoglobulin domain-containing protein, partial [Niastella populi]|uniref:immunoglobulin domain-containing protein n=1 Tax=Niastella populi TaxID=550983 RepID=UPI0013FE211F